MTDQKCTSNSNKKKQIERYVVEYTMVINVVNKVLSYDKEILSEDELKSIGKKVVRLKKKYPNAYTIVKIS